MTEKKISDATLTTAASTDLVPIGRPNDTTARHVTVATLVQAQQSSASARGSVELATTAETITGTDDERAVTPAGLRGAEEDIIIRQIGGDPSTNTVSDDGATLGINNVVSGGYGIALGAGNTVTEQYGIAIGAGNAVQATNGVAIGFTCSAPVQSLATGYYTKTRVLNQRAHGAYLGAAGDAQFSEYHLARTTLNATPVSMSIAANTRITVPSGAVMVFHVYVSAATSGAAKAGAWIFYGAIRNAGGTTALMGDVTKLFESETDAGWDVAITADDTNDQLLITVTGAAATNIEWKATVLANEIINA